MLHLKKLHIKELPLKDIAAMTETELEAWVVANQLNRFQSWLLPQLVAEFGAWKLVTSSSGIDVQATLKQNCEQSPEAQALWRLSRVPRQHLVTRQIAVPEYAVLTPLILAGFKRMQGVGYSSWKNCENLGYIIEPRLFEAVALPAGTCPTLGSDRLLEIRTQGLTTRSGAKAGQLKSPESTWSLTGIADTEIGHLPKLTQTMLTQIWLAHPSHRSSMMILDPEDWDRLPEPLLANNVFKKSGPQEIAPLQKKVEKSDKTLLPWM